MANMPPAHSPTSRPQPDLPPKRIMDPGHDDGNDQFQELLTNPRHTASTAAKPVSDESAGNNRILGVVIGQLVKLTPKGHPMVDYPANPFQEPLLASSTWPCQEKDCGTSVALLFVDGDPACPMVVGPIVEPVTELHHENLSIQKMSSTPQAIRVDKDGQELLLTADKQITLLCGKASITLTRAGKILLRGTYLLNRSSGVNRIKGGSVQIN